METKTYTLAAGKVLQLPLPDARFFMLLETVYPIDVELRRTLDGGPEVAIGVEAGFKRWAPENQHGFAYCTITSAETQTIKIGFSRLYHIGYDRSIGVVSVIDGAEALVRAGKVRMGNIGLSQLAANYANLQLWNPAGSGKELKVRKVHVSTSAAQIVRLKSDYTARATFVAKVLSKDFANPNHDSGAERRTEHMTSTVGVGNGVIWAAHLAAGIAAEIDLGEPIIVRPGSGLLAQADIVNTDLHMSVSFVEENQR